VVLGYVLESSDENSARYHETATPQVVLHNSSTPFMSFAMWFRGSVLVAVSQPDRSIICDRAGCLHNVYIRSTSVPRNPTKHGGVLTFTWHSTSPVYCSGPLGFRPGSGLSDFCNFDVDLTSHHVFQTSHRTRKSAIVTEAMNGTGERIKRFVLET
jgi:hypothetical protein